MPAAEEGAALAGGRAPAQAGASGASTDAGLKLQRRGLRWSADDRLPSQWFRPDIELAGQPGGAVMGDGVIAFGHHHRLEGGERGIFGERDHIPQVLDLADHQTADHTGIMRFRTDLGEFGLHRRAVEGIGFAARQMRVAAVGICRRVAEFEQVDHDERAIVRRAEKGGELVGRGDDGVGDVHFASFLVGASS